MSTYQQSTTIAEVRAKHPFPWTEQRMTNAAGGFVRMVDATSNEVMLFEITALCRILSLALSSRDTQAQSPVSEPSA